MQDEWEIMKTLAKLNNQNKMDEAYKLLLDTELKSNTHLADMAITVFEITKENIQQNISLAKKLSILEQQNMRGAYRQALLSAIIDDLQI